MDSYRSNELPNPKRLKALASNIKYSGGNSLLQQFVLDNSHPNTVGSANYINAVLLSISDISVNAINNDGYTALHLSVLKNNLLMMKKLLSCLVNIDVNEQNYYRSVDSALHLAAKLGHLDIIKLLVSSGANVNLRGGEALPIHYAAESGNLATVEFLVSCGADLNTTGYNNMTVLHYTVRSGNFATVEFLVTHFTDVNIKDVLGKTALGVAAELRDLEAVKLLVNRGADVNIKDGDRKSVLCLAVESGDLGIVKYLVRNSANVNDKDKHNRTPLHFAMSRNNLKTAEFLVDQGADLHVVDIDG